MPVPRDDLDEEGSALLGDHRVDSKQLYYESLNCAAEETENGEDDETVHVETAKYWYRWWICAIFSLFGMMQGAIWNAWAPIDESADCAFGFSDDDIDLLTNWGPISFLITMPIIMWMLDKYGLRLPNLISAFGVALGTGLRCLPLNYKTLKYFMHVGQFLNGIGGCVIMAAPPQLSNAWFPPEERVTATSLTSLFNYLGTGVAYIIGPLMVQQPSEDYSENGTGLCKDLDERHKIRKQIMNLMYVEFEVSLFVFICMLIYFPSHPPKPPSASASMNRMEFFQGIKALRHRRTFLIVTLTFSLVLGGYGGWTGALSVILKASNVSQDEAGRLGFFMTLVGCVVGMLIGWFADRFKGHIKLMITILFAIAFIAYLYYISMTQNWIKVKGFEFSHVGLWISCIIIGIAMNAAVPLGMEMGADAAYPTSEAISASVIVWFFNVLSFVLLLVLQITNPEFTNYLMLSFIGVSIPLLIFFAKEPVGRLHIDLANPVNTMKNDKNPALDSNVNVPNGIESEDTDCSDSPLV